MNIDKIDDVLSDYNTLNLHKVSKLEFELIMKSRTDLATMNSDSGQNFLYANSGEPLELEPRLGKYQLFKETELASTNYKVVNDSTVTRYKSTPRLQKIENISGVTKELVKLDGKYTITIYVYPDVSGMEMNIQCTSELPSGVTVTRKSNTEFELELKAEEISVNELTLRFEDVSDKRLDYESTGVYSELTIKLTDPATDYQINELYCSGPTMITKKDNDSELIYLYEYSFSPSNATEYDLNAEIVQEEGIEGVELKQLSATKFQLNITTTKSELIKILCTDRISGVTHTSYIAINVLSAVSG